MSVLLINILRNITINISCMIHHQILNVLLCIIKFYLIFSKYTPHAIQYFLYYECYKLPYYYWLCNIFEKIYHILILIY